MNCAREARELANYISNLRDQRFETFDPPTQFAYFHIGALYTDIILQAGVNYNTVVGPRVQRVLLNYPNAITLKAFVTLISNEGLPKVINWKHSEKLDRMQRVIDYSLEANIDSCSDLKGHLLQKKHQEAFLEINGIGPKTLDYVLKLLKVDIVAVDRHIYSFVEMAKLPVKGYEDTKKVVEFAADLLQISRSALDYSIWKFMSNKDTSGLNHSQMRLPF